MMEDKIKPTLKELGIENIHPLHREPTANELNFPYLAKELKELNQELDKHLSNEEE